MRSVDAVWHWFATKFDTDQFLVYVFAGENDSLDEALAELMRRATGCRDFTLRVRPHRMNLAFPRWVPATTTPTAVVSPIDRLDWQAFLNELASLMAHQLDSTLSTWCIHVFRRVDGVPHANGPSTVVVLQISHALGDGTRTAALAGWLFGRSVGPAPVESPRDAFARRLLTARRARQQMLRDTAAVAVPTPKPAVPALSTNAPLSGRRILRTVACRRDELPGPTLLVGALAAVSEALSGYLGQRGEDVSQLTADVAIAKPGKPRARNHFVTVPVGLHPDAPTQAERYERIVADLMTAHRRLSHSSFIAKESVSEAIPAALRRLSVWRLSADTEATTVSANTVVSVVDRGPADLSFGGRPAFLAASYPSLLPMMGLTHGVHRLGDNVAVSVHTTDSVIDDIDEYVDRLQHALLG